MSVLDLFRLDGKVAVVTGASSGLGVVMARTLAEAGADLVITGRRYDRLEQTAAMVEEMGVRALAVKADVSSVDDCQAVAALADAFGEVAVLVNNAGVVRMVAADEETPDDFREVMSVNLDGAYWMAKAIAPTMRCGGSIVNVSSMYGLRSSQYPIASYTASKSALIGLTMDLARQWGGDRGIRVNAVAPGFFPTEMTEPNAAALETYCAGLPVSRLGRIEEVASVVLLLATAAGGYMTGSTVVVDGGATSMC